MGMSYMVIWGLWRLPLNCFFYCGMIVQHTSLTTFKNKNWVQNVYISFEFSQIHTQSKVHTNSNIYTYISTNITLPPHAFGSKLLTQFWLDIWIFMKKLELISGGWFTDTGLEFKHSPHIFDMVEVSTFRRPFQIINVSLLYPFRNQFWCVLRIVVQLEHPICATWQYHWQ